MTFPIDVTSRALVECRRRLDKRSGGALRVGVKGGGCSGFSYVLQFEDEPAREKDHVVFMGTFFDPLAIQDDFEPTPSVEVRIDPKSALLMSGTVLDYVDDGLKGKGFLFTNPQEKSKCGCGVSFQV